MPDLAKETAVTEKTRELCQTILEAPGMREVRQRINSFLADDPVQQQYHAVMAKGRELQEKQQGSLPLSGDEIAAFESDRDSLLANPVARGFIDAQDELHQLQDSIHRYVTKTLELGRIPTEDDLSPCGCGSGCGCDH